MRLKFTQLILPDNRVLSVVGNLQSLPGSTRNRTSNKEGTLEPVDQIDADVYTVVKTMGAGFLVGSLSHAGLAGVGYGALIGGAGLAKVLFTRGDEISLPVGTRVEMVLHHPPHSAARISICPCSPPQPRSTQGLRPPRQPQRDNVPCLRDGVTLQCVSQ